MHVLGLENSGQIKKNISYPKLICLFNEIPVKIPLGNFGSDS